MIRAMPGSMPFPLRLAIAQPGTKDAAVSRSHFLLTLDPEFFEPKATPQGQVFAPSPDLFALEANAQAGVIDALAHLLAVLDPLKPAQAPEPAKPGR